MDESEAFDNWPDYLPGPRNDLLALGVVSLNYGYLENMFRIIFAMTTGMSEVQVDSIFTRINNRMREEVFEQLLAASAFPPALNAMIKHFLDGYGICANNRNDIMHSHHGGVHSGARGTEGIVLSKFSRNGTRKEIWAHAALLRQVADDIDRQSDWGREVILAISSYQLCRSQNRIEDFGKFPLPDKRPLPSALRWLSPQDAQAAQRQPQSSPG